MLVRFSLTTLGLATLATMVTIPTSRAQTIFDLVEENMESSTLEALLVATGLDEPLRAPEPLTVFAPSDNAFEAFFHLDPELAGAFQTDVHSWMTHITDLLLFHVVPGRNLIHIEDVGSSLTLTTLNGEDLMIDIVDRGFTVRPAAGGVARGLASISVDNGDANLVDHVLTPSWLTQSIIDVTAGWGEFSILVGLLTTDGLEELLHALHTEFGLTVRVRYILTVAEMRAVRRLIMTTLACLTHLVTFPQLFAPLDSAFHALGDDVMSYLESEAGKLDMVKILTYHVVLDVIGWMSIATGSSTQVPTLYNGATIEVVGTETDVLVNYSTVVSADILARNGVVHAIDRVLIPEDVQASIGGGGGTSDGKGYKGTAKGKGKGTSKSSSKSMMGCPGKGKGASASSKSAKSTLGKGKGVDATAKGTTAKGKGKGIRSSTGKSSSCMGNGKGKGMYSVEAQPLRL